MDLRVGRIEEGIDVGVMIVEHGLHDGVEGRVELLLGPRRSLTRSYRRRQLSLHLTLFRLLMCLYLTSHLKMSTVSIFVVTTRTRTAKCQLSFDSNLVRFTYDQ